MTVKRSRWLAASLAALATAAAAPAGAATVVEKSVSIDLSGPAVRERVRLTVRIDERDDLAAWSPYTVGLDQNRKLVHLAASTLVPGGRATRVPEKAMDWLDWAGDGILHSSQRLRVVRFPAVPPGSLLTVEHEVESRPYFPAAVLALREEDPVERLRVEVRAPAGPWRWTVAGDREGLTVEETAEGLVLTATPLSAADDRELAPSAAALGPTLHLAWGGGAGWEGVGAWFLELSRSVPRASAEVRRQARELVAGVAGARERLATLLGFAQREVRYVAVEVGIGGYRPSPPAETLGRRWGDCKDKAFLLIDLLAEAGIPAYPALIGVGGPEPLVPELPSPLQFDHMIVAVPAEPLGLGAADGVSEGYLFVDPTDPAGSVGWLPPVDRGRSVLVVRPEGSALVAPPPPTADQGLHLTLDLAVDERGDAGGAARLEFRGSGGAAVAEWLAGLDPRRAEAELQGFLARWLPGSGADGVTWTRTPDAPSPVTAIAAELRIPAFLQRLGDGGSIDLRGSTTLEAPKVFAERSTPWVLEPRLDRTSWRLDLSRTGCRVDENGGTNEVAVDYPVGRFRQAVSQGDGGAALIERETEIRRRWVEPAQGTELRELALAEHRTAKRRLRLSCGG